MKNKYLLYLGLMGVCTPLSMLLWVWWIIDLESLSNLVSQSSKFYTLMGGILISLFFAVLTVYFMIRSRVQCSNCGADLEQQIIQAEKLATVGQLAGGVAHEVNTPASIISGRVETMLLEPDRLGAQDQEDLRVIQRQADRISQITRGLLLFSKRNPAEKGKSDLNEIVKESVSLVETQLKKTGVEITQNLFPSSLTLWGQHNQLVQVVLNMLTNARDAMPKGGRIEMETGLISGSRERFYLKVKDTGVGILPDQLRKIFDPFYTSKENGTGLGLSVSYGIVQDHGGTISVQSQVGTGTTFTIVLPAMKGKP